MKKVLLIDLPDALLARAADEDIERLRKQAWWYTAKVRVDKYGCIDFIDLSGTKRIKRPKP